MPPKTFKCVVCNNEVSKRKSLAFADGRACRDHEEVKAAIKAAEDEARLEKLSKEADENLMVIMYTEQIRVMHTIQGWPLSFLYDRVKRAMKRGGIDLKVLDRIKEQVQERGPKISMKEMEQSIITWAVFQCNRQNADGKTSESI